MAHKDKTIATHTIGCKLNFAETSTISRGFLQQGYTAVKFEDGADLYLLNTCSVTENANRKCRKIIRQIKRRSPDSMVAVTGCYAQLNPEEIYDIPGVDIVIGAEKKFQIPSVIENLSDHNQSVIQHSCIDQVTNFVSSYSEGKRTRAFLKIQDGCDYPCTYCTIPLARGRSRSDSIENILVQARGLIRRGMKEIVLTGVNVGDFKTERNERFIDLLYQLTKIKDLVRIRISSIEPNLLTDEIIRFVKNSDKMVPHFHIPLQSGSDHILQLMKRRYNRGFYRDRIQKIHQEIEKVCIGADVIVGFPGETNDEFRDTCNFIRELELAYLHVFSYSSRDNTPAKKMNGQVPITEIRRRSSVLHQISQQKTEDYYQSFIGSVKPVLFESFKDNILTGHTDNYLKTQVKIHENLVNTIHNVRLKAYHGETMIGMIVN